MADDKKPTPRHTRMYANSPKLERKEDGNMGISKAEKKSAEVNSGTEGVVKSTDALDLIQKQAKERFDLHQKHEKEFIETGMKHVVPKEDSGDTGADKIEKIEKNEKE